ncbi:MAG TPA: hypothetical protein VL588_01580 [Bdellovibrionota bacterium]|nr:hypothetical protein [Bdellovibrionota bacterium]
MLLSQTAEARTRLDDCSMPSGAACGQCEAGVLSNFDRVMTEAEGGSLTSVEAFVGRLREIDPNITNNFQLIGDSLSLQGTRPGKPRIAFKSPNSELWVTVNTDPNSTGYNTVEIMRWNGAAGRYDFQEVCFDQPAASGRPARGCSGGGSGHGPSIHAEGGPTTAAAHVRRDAHEDCVRCHRDPARPNFDTYVAWAGFIPARDDVLEKDQPETQQYLDIMDQVVHDHEHPTSPPSRWSLLNVPPSDGFSRDVGSGEHLHSSADISSERDRLRYMRQQIALGVDQGSAGNGSTFGSLPGYRIPHTPPKSQLANYDSATADFAGYGHLAFDQSMNQQMCQVQRTLRERPDFNQIKYSIAAVGAGCIYSAQDAVGFMGGGTAPVRADDFFRQSGLHPTPADTHAGATAVPCQTTDTPACPGSGYTSTKVCRLRCSTGSGYRYMFGTDCPGGWEAMAGTCAADGSYSASGGNATQVRGNPGELFSAVRDHTSANQNLLDQQKRERHARFLESGSTHPLSHADAETQGNRVGSVGEDATGQVAALRYLLEPLGVRMQDWSMSYGSNLAIPSYTFADQFDLFFKQRMFDEMRQEYDNRPQPHTGDYCSWLQARSAASFPQPASVPAAPPGGPDPAREAFQRLFTECGTNGRVAEGSTVPRGIDDTRRAALEAAQALLRTDGMNTLSNTCMGCHDSGSMSGGNPFPPEDPADTYANRLREFLGSTRGSSGMTWLETMTVATDPNSHTAGINHMPPNTDPHGGIQDRQERAAFLGYMTSVALSSDGTGTGYACETIAQDQLVGRSVPASMSSTGTGGADRGD